MKIPGPPFGYTHYMDEQTIDRSKEYKKAYFPLRPSSAGECGRKLAYRLAEFYNLISLDAEIKPAATTRLLDLGHYIELAAIKQFYSNQKEFKIKYKQQSVTLFKLNDTKQEKGALIEGQVDLVLWSDDFKCVMDVKSAKDKFSAAYYSKWDETLAKLAKSEYTKVIGDSSTDFFITDLKAFMDNYNDPFLNDNLLQLNAYGSTQFFKERGVDHCSILKYNKNDSRWYELRFTPNPEIFKSTEDKFNTVFTEVNKVRTRINKIRSKVKETIKKEPDLDESDEERLVGRTVVSKVPRDFQLGNIKCSFCPYNKSCWGKEEREIKREYFKTMPYKKWPRDTSRLGNHEELEKLFGKFESLKEGTDRLKLIEQSIISELEKAKQSKVKLDNGNVYMVKVLKQGPVLRRSKL